MNTPLLVFFDVFLLWCDVTGQQDPAGGATESVDNYYSCRLKCQPAFFIANKQKKNEK